MAVLNVVEGYVSTNIKMSIAMQNLSNTAKLHYYNLSLE